MAPQEPIAHPPYMVHHVTHLLVSSNNDLTPGAMKLTK